jgi:hypothetical protein
MHRRRARPLLVPVALAFSVAVAASVGCTTSEPVDIRGAAGTTGAAGQGVAGTTGAAGTPGGAAGTTGAAGTPGTAGTTGAAGTPGTAGTTGAAGAGVADAGAAGAGAAGTGGTPDAGAALSFATDILPIINTNCHDCHQTAKDGNLDLTAANAYKSLVGTGTGGAVLTNTGCTLLDTKKLRVSPGDPTHSLLYLKISTADATLKTATCGDSMPKNKTMPLNSTDAADVTKIMNWIMQGANP